jgi:hypothetical protein
MTASAITSLGEKTEVAGEARLRQFTVEFERRIGNEADACTAPGEVGPTAPRTASGRGGTSCWRLEPDLSAAPVGCPRALADA